MRPIVLALISLSLFASSLGAQQVEPIDIKSMIADGIARFDAGEYAKAEARFREVLAIEPRNLQALYELAFTRFALKEYSDAETLAAKGAREKSPYQPSFYELLGNRRHTQGNAKGAEKAYKAGLEIAPDSATLHFNLGITYTGLERWKEAAVHLRRNVVLRPGHASGHHALAETWRRSGLRVPAILAYIRFLSLESGTQRSVEDTQQLWTLLNAGVTKKDDKNIEVLVAPDSKTDEGDFNVAAMTIAIMSAGRFTEEGEVKSEAEHLSSILDTLFSVLAETPAAERAQTLTWQYYIPFALEMREKKLTGTFAWATLASAGVPSAAEWPATHAVELQTFQEWVARKGKEPPAALAY